MTNDHSIKNLLQAGVKFPLFDIDGTLVTGGNKVHHDAFDYALHTVYDQPTASCREIDFHGKIDSQILIEVLKLHNVDEDEAKRKIESATKAMVHYFERHAETGKHILLEGVTELLQELYEKHVPIGLLTGNVEDIGWAKMELAGIRKYFSFGAFGNLAFKREDLISVAHERLEAIAQTKIPLKNLVIVGDTPLDIACAKKGGIEVIAVATGNYSVAVLQKEGADLVVSSLTDKTSLLRFLHIA